MAISLRYRFEFHTSTTGVSFGPAIGVKTKLFDVDPFDKFLASPDQVNKTFYFLGVYLGFPMSGQSLFTLEGIILNNTQSLVLINGGLHFML